MVWPGPRDYSTRSATGSSGGIDRQPELAAKNVGLAGVAAALFAIARRSVAGSPQQRGRWFAGLGWRVRGRVISARSWMPRGRRVWTDRAGQLRPADFVTEIDVRSAVADQLDELGTFPMRRTSAVRCLTVNRASPPRFCHETSVLSKPSYQACARTAAGHQAATATAAATSAARMATAGFPRLGLIDWLELRHKMVGPRSIVRFGRGTCRSAGAS